MKHLIIVGAGGLGRECLQIAKDMIEGKTVSDWEIKGFLDDNLEALNGKECSHGVLGKIDGYQPAEEEIFACAIANPKIKEKVMHGLQEKGARFVNLIHPDAKVGETAKLGVGIVMYPFSILSVNTVMGDFVILNMHSVIGHDAVVGNCTTISSFCDITGNVKLGDRVFLGSHSSIVPGIQVQEDAYVCAGSTVMTRVKAGTKVLGTPAKRFSI